MSATKPAPENQAVMPADHLAHLEHEQPPAAPDHVALQCIHWHRRRPRHGPSEPLGLGNRFSGGGGPRPPLISGTRASGTPESVGESRGGVPPWVSEEILSASERIGNGE